MNRRIVVHLPLMIVLVGTGAALSACATETAEPSERTDPFVSAGTSQREEPSAPSSEAVAPESQAAPSVAAPVADPAALDLPLLGTADLPSDVPVPVPAGGTVNDDLSVFEGQSFVVEYPTPMYEQISAFYDAWFADQGIPVPPEFVPEQSRLWRPTIADEPVQVELYPLDPGDQVRLFITWP
jgi:hypothetical protein